jgi:hypothetical protein
MVGSLLLSLRRATFKGYRHGNLTAVGKAESSRHPNRPRRHLTAADCEFGFVVVRVSQGVFRVPCVPALHSFFFGPFLTPLKSHRLQTRSAKSRRITSLRKIGEGAADCKPLSKKRLPRNAFSKPKSFYRKRRSAPTLRPERLGSCFGGKKLTLVTELTSVWYPAASSHCASCDRCSSTRRSVPC